jgi:hypothetical protein
MSLENFLKLSPLPVPPPEEVGAPPVLLQDFKESVEIQKNYSLCWASVISAILRLTRIKVIAQCELVNLLFSGCSLAKCEKGKCGDQAKIEIIFGELGFSLNGLEGPPYAMKKFQDDIDAIKPVTCAMAGGEHAEAVYGYSKVEDKLYVVNPEDPLSTADGWLFTEFGLDCEKIFRLP